MLNRISFAFLVCLASFCGPFASLGQTKDGSGVFVAGMNALCSGGKALAEGCDRIRARDIVDAADAPWRAIGRVNFASARVRSHCTGTLIAEHIVLTAAHCLFNTRDSYWIPPERLRFAAGYQRNAAVAVSDVERYVLDPIHDPSSDIYTKDAAVDWALLVLKTPIGRDVGFATLDGRGDLGGADVAIAGYAGLRQHVLSVASDCGAPDFGRGSVIITRCAAMMGDSGSALMYSQDGQIMVLGTLSAVATDQAGLFNISVPVSTFEAAFEAEMATQ